MDQDLLRRAYQEINERFCAYEKAMLARYCDCSRAERFCIAEREGISCASDAAQEQCLDFLTLLRHQARFTLKNVLEHAVMPHAKELRIQVGGLRGLQLALNSRHSTKNIIDDVYALIERAKAQFGSLDDLPSQTIIQQIAAFKGRDQRHKTT